MKDHYGDARAKNRASTHALMKRSGYADGGDVGDTVDTQTPTPRPLYGADDAEFSTRTNGPLQTGHMNTKTGETTMDAKVAPWRKGTK